MLISRSAFAQLRAVYEGQGRNLDFRQPLLVGDTEFGSIQIGVSTLLIRRDLNGALGPAAATALIALAVAIGAAVLLAQLLLRPIHVIRSGLTRLGRGEFGVRLDLSQHDEFGELGTFFNTVSAQLSADRSQMAGQVANLESAVEHLEDAVAVVSPSGTFLSANPAMRALLPGASTGAALDDLLGARHPLRQLWEETLASRQPRGPVSMKWARSTVAADEEQAKKRYDALSDSGDHLISAYPVSDAGGDVVGIMLIVRNLEYLSRVQSTMRYSRKLAALGRLSAGVAHEVENPLNAMMIHLELLRQQFAPRPSAVARASAGGGVAAATAAPPVGSDQAIAYVDVIAGEIRRLDEVVQGFLRFTRPEDLKLQPLKLSALLAEVVPIVRPEADRAGVHVLVDCDGAPDVNGDAAMLRQAFLNLALNACQAMPGGGTLGIRAEAVRHRRVAVIVSDTGVGIAPQHLQRIFELYYTTRPGGSGIGLSMVYRTIQMHDGEIEVQSTPGKGTVFRVLLPQA